jgi:hypothetical protein
VREWQYWEIKDKDDLTDKSSLLPSNVIKKSKSHEGDFEGRDSIFEMLMPC